jgi:hypothetical protein
MSFSDIANALWLWSTTCNRRIEPKPLSDTAPKPITAENWIHWIALDKVWYTKIGDYKGVRSLAKELSLGHSVALNAEAASGLASNQSVSAIPEYLSSPVIR